MATPRRIAVLTGGRSEYGLLYWTIRGIQQDPELELILLVTGMHLSPEFGQTVRDIEADGFPIAARIETLLSSDTGEGTATSMGLGTIKTAQALTSLQPDILLVQGDRPEVLAAATAALPMTIPVAHIHGGESSEGAIDEGIRHAVTKLSHIHFPATDFYAQRLMQMGEEEWRVHVCGAPGLEHRNRTPLADKGELEKDLGLDLDRDLLLVTHHPVTQPSQTDANEIDELLGALEETGLPVLITYPNADKGGRSIIQRIEAFQSKYPLAQVRVNLGTRMYLGLLGHVSAMVGNSSSGIIEAASFGLPVVNVGERQRGRLRGANIIDVPGDKKAILGGIKQALAPDFRQMAAECPNPYDRGGASGIILKALKGVELGPGLLQKRLVDLPSTIAAQPAGARI